MLDRGVGLSGDEQELLARYRDGKEREYAEGYEDALKYLVTVLIWVIGPEKATPRETLAMNLLAEFERQAIGNAPKHAACTSLRGAVEFYRRVLAGRFPENQRGDACTVKERS